MAHWREEYLAALAVRDHREKSNIVIYDAYTRLADISAKSPHTIETSGRFPGDRGLTGTSETQKAVYSQSTATQKHQTEANQPITELLNTTRAELAEAQRSRSELQDRLDRTTNEAGKLRKKIDQDGRRMNTLENEVTQQQKRRKDVEEELRGKAKLLDDFQDEIAALNLQVNMAEQKAAKLERENKELVERWMARMGQEADAMNDASKFS